VSRVRSSWKNDAVKMQVPFGKLRAGFRLRLPYNHPSDEDLSLGTPATRQTALWMTDLF
jgi:hypothetical protein